MNRQLNLIPLCRSSRNVSRFLNLSYGIYRNDPHWVAPLLMDLKKVFTDANPLFAHADMQLWLVTQGDRDIGRIAAVLDHNHNSAQKDSAVFFGFFECEDNHEASRLLFETVSDWAKQKGARRLLGPMNPTSNDECGLLIRGFDSPPQFMMTYNPPYYEKLVEAAGFCKAKDLLAFQIDIATAPLDRLAKIAAKTRQRNPDLKFKPVRRRTLSEDLSKIKEIYNDAWQENWGFVPMTDAEIDFMAKRLKPLLMEGLIWIAETAREPVGFMLALPDYNEALKPLRGHLLTPRVLGFIPYLLGRKYPSKCRVITLGVKEAYRSRGLEAVMLTEGFKTGIQAGFKEAEASWILEDNTMMCRLMEIFGGKVYKTYRLYECETQPGLQNLA